MTRPSATVNGRHVLCVVILGFAVVAALSVWGWPLPLPQGAVFQVSEVIKVGITAALLSALAFTASYAWRASAEAERMELALHTTQEVLAREQQLSALGALADRTGIEFVFKLCGYLPLFGLLTAFLPGDKRRAV